MYKREIENKTFVALAKSMFANRTNWNPISRAKVLQACGIPWLLCVSIVDGLEVEDIPFDNLEALELFK